MILSLLSVLIGVFIPIAIVYFQGINKFSDYFCDFHLNISSFFKLLFVTVISSIIIEILDNFNIPSMIIKDLIGKQLYAELIIMSVLIFAYIKITHFYIKYYKFHKNSNIVKYNKLFQHVFDKLIKTQNDNNWKSINQKLNNIENSSDFDYLNSSHTLINGNNQNNDQTIIEIKTKPIEKIKNNIWFRLRCGSRIEHGTWIASFANENDKKLFSKKVRKYVKFGIDYETLLYSLIHTLLDEIKIGAKNKNYQIIRECISALTTTTKTISSSQIYLDNIKELMSNLYWAMEDLIDTSENNIRISSMVKSFMKSFAILSINENNSTVIDLSFQLSLNKKFIEFESDNNINQGFIYDVHRILLSIYKTTDKDLIFSRTFIKRLFTTAQDFTENEIKILIDDIPQKLFLFNSIDFYQKEHLYYIFILFISFIEDSERYKDIEVNNQVKTYINTLQIEIFEPNSKLLSFVEKLKLFIR